MASSKIRESLHIFFLVGGGDGAWWGFVEESEYFGNRLYAFKGHFLRLWCTAYCVGKVHNMLLWRYNENGSIL